MELKKVIKTIEKRCPFDDELWVLLYEDINMSVIDSLNMDNQMDMKNAYVIVANVVADWNFADMNGEKLEISVNGVRKLPSKIAEWIINESTEIIKIDEDKKKD